MRFICLFNKWKTIMILRHGLQNAKSCSWNPLYGVSPNHCLQKTLRVKLMDKRKRCKTCLGIKYTLEIRWWNGFVSCTFTLSYPRTTTVYTLCLADPLISWWWPCALYTRKITEKTRAQAASIQIQQWQSHVSFGSATVTTQGPSGHA